MQAELAGGYHTALIETKCDVLQKFPMAALVPCPAYSTEITCTYYCLRWENRHVKTTPALSSPRYKACVIFCLLSPVRCMYYDPIVRQGEIPREQDGWCLLL